MKIKDYTLGEILLILTFSNKKIDQIRHNFVRGVEVSNVLITFKFRRQRKVALWCTIQSHKEILHIKLLGWKPSSSMLQERNKNAKKKSNHAHDPSKCKICGHDSWTYMRTWKGTKSTSLSSFSGYFHFNPIICYR